MLRTIQYGTALLVDRNGFQRKMLRTLLRSSGFNRVSEFDDMESGLAEARRSYPDFLFADFDTAKQSDLLRGQHNIKDTYLPPNTHLVFLMQHPTQNRVKNAITCGGKWVISRPFSPTILNRRIRAILDPSLCVPITPVKVREKHLITSSKVPLEDMSMSELTRQMDGLLKSSRFFKEDQASKNQATPKQPQAKQEEEEEEDIFLI